jgi:hypothetical protein
MTGILIALAVGALLLYLAHLAHVSNQNLHVKRSSLPGYQVPKDTTPGTVPPPPGAAGQVLQLGKSHQVQGWSGEIALDPDRKGKVYGWGLTIKGRKVRWASVRPDDRVWACPIVGMKYRPPKAQKVYRSYAMGAGNPVRLHRDKMNKFDPNAVEVWDKNLKAHVGYLPQEWSEVVAKELDAGRTVRAWSIWEQANQDGERSAIYLLFLRGGLTIEQV